METTKCEAECEGVLLKYILTIFNDNFMYKRMVLVCVEHGKVRDGTMVDLARTKEVFRSDIYKISFDAERHEIYWFLK